MILVLAAVLVAFTPTPPRLVTGAAEFGADGRFAERAPDSPRTAIPSEGNVVRGTASHVGTAYGRRYLALPGHRWGRPGITVRICGGGGCVVRTSTDAGPSLAMQRAGRVADLNAWDFEAVCGIPPSRGLCPVTVFYGAGPVPTPPATSTEG